MAVVWCYISHGGCVILVRAWVPRQYTEVPRQYTEVPRQYTEVRHEGGTLSPLAKSRVRLTSMNLVADARVAHARPLNTR